MSENVTAKKRIKIKDPSHEVFSEYLRRVYTFGCWQILTMPILMASEEERHARYLERYPEKWSRIEEYAQTNLVLPRYDESGENGLQIER